MRLNRSSSENTVVSYLDLGAEAPPSSPYSAAGRILQEAAVMSPTGTSSSAEEHAGSCTWPIAPARPKEGTDAPFREKPKAGIGFSAPGDNATVS